MQTDAAAIEALSEAEQQVLTALQHWGELFEPTPEGSGQTEKEKSKSGDAAKLHFNELAIQLIDNLMATLNELRSEFHKSTGST